MNDTIERQAAIDAIDVLKRNYPSSCFEDLCKAVDIAIKALSAQSETSRIEQELHGKTPEEQYNFLYWLLFEFALTYTDSRLAVVEWLRGDKQ